MILFLVLTLILAALIVTGATLYLRRHKPIVAPVVIHERAIEPKGNVELGTNFEREGLGGGRFQHTQYMKPIAYLKDGSLHRNVLSWATGDATFASAVEQCGLRVRVTADGMRRILPLVDDDKVFIDLGAPYILNAQSKWTQVNLGQAVRAANSLTWTTAQADVRIIHAGNYIKLEIPLKNGWVPRNSQVAFPFTLSGLDFKAGVLYGPDGKPLVSLRAPVVYDAGNADDTRPIDWRVASVAGQTYIVLTLPSLVGMTQPVIDPTLVLQPDAAAGVDTWLYSVVNPTCNQGITPTLVTGGEVAANRPLRGLLRFSGIVIPAGVTITAATLTLYCESEADTSDRVVGAHRALTQWFEGNQNTAVPLPGENASTWNLRNANGAVAWAGGAGGGSGSDYVATATDTQTITAPLVSYNWIVLADVQAWYAGTATNYGWWLICTAENTTDSRKRFTSSDGTAAANRPKLTITYTVPGGGGSKHGLLKNSIRYVQEF